VILLVRAYWEWLHGTWPSRRAVIVIVASAAWAAINGWAGFIAIASCAAHAAWELGVRRNRRAAAPVVLLVAVPLVLFAAVLGQLLWILGGNVDYLRTLLASRMAGGDSGVLPWVGRILELHWRYFGLTSALGLAGFVYRALRQRHAAQRDPAQEVGMIFLLSGAGYVAIFAHNATLHDYWQFLLLPASVIGVVLLLRPLVQTADASAFAARPWLRRALLALAIFDMAAVTTVTLVQRHVKREGYCLQAVEEIRRNFL